MSELIWSDADDFRQEVLSSSIEEYWQKSGSDLYIERPGDRSCLKGVVKSYTCKGHYGVHAVMRSVMCLTGWLGMKNNYPNKATSFCDHMGTSHCLGLFDDTWVVEVYDDGWQLYMLRVTPEGLWDVRFLEKFEKSCKMPNDSCPVITRANFKAFHVHPLGINDDEWDAAAPDLAAVLMSTFGIQHLTRLDIVTTRFLQSYGANVTVRSDSVVRKDIFLNVLAQPYGETMGGKDVSRYEIFREQGSWYVGREGAQKAELVRRNNAIAELLD